MQAITRFKRKVTPPILPAVILNRSNLLNQLHNFCTGVPQRYKLGLLCAPAGYGKTTLLADFVQREQLSCCWYTLDQSDQDQHEFLYTIVMSIRECFPAFGSVLDELFAASSRTDAYRQVIDPQAILDLLIERLESEITQPFLLVFCNYQEVNEQEALNALVNRFLRKMPAHCTLLIESRSVPALEFAPLLAKRQVFGLSSQDFHLSVAEIRELARIQGIAPPGEAEAEKLSQSFTGWITGILLGTRLGGIEFLHNQNAIDNGQHTSIAINQDSLLPYLVHEVFGKEPELYAFLKEAALLRTMVPDFCETLLQRPGAGATLRLLENRGFFVFHRNEQDQTVYYCHPVLREILSQTLAREHPERFIALHHRAAQLFFAQQDYEAALEHALEAQDNALVAHFIKNIYEPLLSSGDAETVRRWIDSLPELFVTQDPHLLVIRASICTIQGDHVQALTLLDRVDTLLHTQQNIVDQEDHLQIVKAMVRSRAHFQAGDYLHSREVCHEILANGPANEVAIRAEAHTLLGIEANMQGEFTTGITHLQRALYLWGGECITRQTIDLHSMLASAYSLQGNFALAEHHMTRALNSLMFVSDEHERVMLLIRMGLLKQRQGSYAEAEQAFKQALQAARGSIRFRRGEAYALVNLGELYQEQGRYIDALVALEDGLRMARHIQDTYLICGGLCTLATTYLFMRDSSTALLIFDEARRKMAETSFSKQERQTLDFTHGTILLFTNELQAAMKLLSESCATWKAMGLKRDHLKAILRLATCHFLLGDQASGRAVLHEAATLLTSMDDYEELLRSEIKRLPGLLSIIEHDATYKDLKMRLHGDEGENASEKVVAVPTVTSAKPKSEASCEIRALGEPMVILNGEQVTRWRRSRAVELLFYLLAKDKPVHKGQLIDDLWPEDSPTDQAFRSTIHCLRKVLGDRCILSQNSFYSLDLTTTFGTRVYYDVAILQQVYEQAKQALSEKAKERAKRALLTVVKLYQGDYVQSFYSNWCIFQRDQLKRIYQDSLSKLATLLFQEEAWEESIHYWQNMLGIDRCMEEAHYGLMQCYIHMGKRGLALRQYQQCVQILDEELAAIPNAKMRKLYQSLLASEVTDAS